MTDLADFLLARIAEDEAIVRAATQSEKWWDWVGSGHRKTATVRTHEGPYIALNLEDGNASHIARWDPRRVLAECQAKRRLVTEAAPRVEVTTFSDAVRQYVPGPPDMQLLELLALPYADHPDYREEWRR